MRFRWFQPAPLGLFLVAVVALGCSDDGNLNRTLAGDSSDAGVGDSGNAGFRGTNGAASSGAGGSRSNGEALSFASDIWPILTAHCSTTSCHGEGAFLPQHASSDVNMAYEQAKPIADRIAGRVSGEIMPIMPLYCGPGPGFGTCLSVADVALISEWAAQSAPP